MAERCVIIGSVKVKDKDKERILSRLMEDDFVICADGGFDVCNSLKITPDLFVGDCDSVKDESYKEFENKIILDRKKDKTDLFFAIDEGLKRGIKDFLLFCAVGERFDHSYANVCLLKYIHDNKGTCSIVSEREQVMLVFGGERLTLNGNLGKTISIFPFGCKLCVVSYSGLKYGLLNDTLYIENPIGISNEIIEDSAHVIVHSGNAMVCINE